jgi:hypothetical protein
VKHAPEILVAVDTDIFQRLIEASDRSLVHFAVFPVAAVNPYD